MEGKKIVVLSDIHCGHYYGLTPPLWQDVRHSLQRTLWDAYVRIVYEIGKVDLVVLNGDGLEGKGKRNEGLELLTADRFEQADMAYQALSIFDTKKFHLTYGTPYHTGEGENFEEEIAIRLEAQIESRAALDVNGLFLDIRHFSPGSQTPMGPVTGLQREKIMALLDDRIDKGGISIRSHIHKFYCVIDHHGAVFTTPCFQTHSEFGAKKCSGDIDLGLLVFTVQDKNNWSWVRHSIDVNIFRREPIKI